jgi:response regulator RpfG family c-di-GMP phosphodiesterase
VARAFAVLRAYVRDSAAGGASLRAESGRRFDPRMVNRFLAFLGEEAGRWNPLDGVADGPG